jgi:hypothetical protein
MSSDSFESLAGYLSTAVRAVADAPPQYIRPNRLARYLARYGIVIGWADNLRQDWAALRRRGFDIVLVPVASQTELQTLGAALRDEELVSNASSLQADEEGTPLRVLPVYLITKSGDLAGRPNGVVVLRPTPDGFEAAGQRLLRVRSRANLNRDFFRRALRLAASDTVSLVIDVDADGLALHDVTGGLLEAGSSPEMIQDLLGGRLQRAVAAALPAR